MLSTSDGKNGYTPTSDDRLWLLRAVQAEGKPQPMVARALVNLFMRARAAGSSQTLAQLVRSYSQPVNPRWYPDGDLFMAKARTASEKEKAEQRRDVASSRLVFAPEVQAAVERALTTPYVGDVTDYAAPNVDATSKGYVPRSVAAPGFNRLWTRDTKWAGYAVGMAGSLVPLLLGLAIIYMAVKHGKA